MLEEACDEGLGIECRPPEFAAGTIAIPEGHGAIVESLDASVGDRDAMDVAADVAEDFSPVAGVLAMDDPLSAPGIGRGLTPKIRLLESIADLAPEDHGERSAGDQEATVARFSPDRAVRIPTACRGEDMDVWVVPHLARPSVQDRDHPQSGTDVLRIGRELRQGFGSRSDQDGIDGLLVGPGQISKLLRQSESEQEIGAWEQALLPGFEPAPRLRSVTLRAMPVLAGVIAVALRLALITAPELASEMWCPAGYDVPHDSPMRGKHSGTEVPAVEISGLAEDLGDLDHGKDQRSAKSLLIGSLAAS